MKRKQIWLRECIEFKHDNGMIFHGTALTAASNNAGATTKLSRTAWIFVTKFNTAVCSDVPGVNSWARFSKACKTKEVKGESTINR